MKTKLYPLLVLLAILPLCRTYGQYTHGMSNTYTWPTDETVLEKLDTWSDQKFGMLIHYGLYSELGIVESWSICAEEEDWIPRDSTVAYDDYKRAYWNTMQRFNPSKLDPESWARYGKEAGIKYVVFTTKHHDGFNMFDTKYSDFKITNGPMKGHPRSNVAKEVFNAFRNEGYMIGAYFSKPDWHSQYYWWDRYSTPTRNVNYNIDKNPWRWEQFKQFTYNQIEELMNGDYGSMDILWLDGGWVAPAKPGAKERQGRNYRGSQDIDMPRIAAMARTYQPGLLVVDRTVPGEYENYMTPEHGIPSGQIDNPWESCITLGVDWGWTPHQKYKSATDIVHKLCEIVAKGGSLLLGVGPKPDGTLPTEVEQKLQEIGQWTSKNGKAIYGTRIVPDYNEGNIWFTRSKDNKTRYALVCVNDNEPLPATVTWKGNEPKKGSRMRHVATGKTVKWTKTNDGIRVNIPSGLKGNQSALAFEFTPAN